MIKVSVLKRGLEDGSALATLIFETNNIEADQETLDLIGEALVGNYERRGGYLPNANGAAIRVQVLMKDKED